MGPTILFKNFYIPLVLGAIGVFSATSANAQSVCDTFYGSGYTLPQGKLAPSMPSLSRPAKGVRVREPSFGTCLVRATDHAAENISTFSRNYYSRRQAFNANNSYFITFSTDGWHLYDAASLKHLRKLSPLVANPSTSTAYHVGGDSEVVWHPTDPNVIYYLSAKGGKKLMKLDVRTNSYSVVADFASSLPSWASTATRAWTRWEGSPSKDARYWGLQLENSSGTRLGYFVWDLQLNKLVGSRQSSVQADHTSMSPSGRWIVLADTASGTGTWAYSPDFKTKKKLFATSGHSDLAIGANGHDYYVGIDYASTKGDVFMADIDACPAVSATVTSAPYCPRTVLFQLYMDGSSTPMHISGKAYDRPGWVLVSTFATRNSRDGSVPWYSNKVFAMEMSANPRIYPLAYDRFTKASGDDYWSETHASTNRDMTRISFNSNWGASNYTDVDTYIVKLPATALPGGVVTQPPVIEEPTRETGGNFRPRKKVSGTLATTSSMKASTTTASTTAEPTTWISPGMRLVRNAITAVQASSVTRQSSIPLAAIWSLPSVAWLRSVFEDEAALGEDNSR